MTANETIRQRFQQIDALFARTRPIFSLTAEELEQHAATIDVWLELIEDIHGNKQLISGCEEEMLAMIQRASRSLFACGDDITAWIGQLRAAELARIYCPGPVCANHYAAAARLSGYLYLDDKAEYFLELMSEHFSEAEDHDMAHQYWSLMGLNNRIRRQWRAAIECFGKSLDHLALCTEQMLQRWLQDSRDEHCASRYLLIADCWTNEGWQFEGEKRWECARNARLSIERALAIPRMAVTQYLTGLNVVEVDILEENYDQARRKIDGLLRWRTLSKQQAAPLQPGAYCMLARIARQEGDHAGMIDCLSTALAQSSVFPNALQENQIVDYALSLLREAAINTPQKQQLFQAMVSMLEAKDWYTGRGHSHSVAHLSTFLWNTWRDHDNGEIDEETLYWAGMLHDVGKLKLPRSLLNKIGPLCDDEWELLRRHPDYGFSIMNALELPDIAELIRMHHQDGEGKGYPGHEPASSPALCITLADIIEAATSINRKYRKPKQLDVLLEELHSLGPRRFPPSLLDAARNLLVEGFDPRG